MRSRSTKPYCSRIGRYRHAVCGGTSPNSTLPAVERRDRQQVEDEQDDVEEDERSRGRQEDDRRDLGERASGLAEEIAQPGARRRWP